MSIASEVTRINNNIAAAYTACNGKGATMPATQDSANLATCISSISGGGDGIPREVVNGTYQIPTTTPFTFTLPNTATNLGSNALSRAFLGCFVLTSVDLSSLTTLTNFSALSNAFQYCSIAGTLDLSNLTTVNALQVMYYAFSGCNSLTDIDLSSLTTVSGSNAMGYTFESCIGLSDVDLSSLTTVSGEHTMTYTFRNCRSLTNIDLSSLTTVSGNYAMSNTFQGCTGLTSVVLSGLTTIGTNSSSGDYGHFSQCFYDCNALTSLSFPNLEKIYCTGGTTTSYGTFANNNKVQKMYFPKLDTITYGTGASSTNQKACKNVFYGCSALTELHFAAANQAAIEASPGYSTAWGRGAGNVTIYFDL